MANLSEREQARADRKRRLQDADLRTFASRWQGRRHAASLNDGRLQKRYGAGQVKSWTPEQAWGRAIRAGADLSPEAAAAVAARGRGLREIETLRRSRAINDSWLSNEPGFICSRISIGDPRRRLERGLSRTRDRFRYAVSGTRTMRGDDYVDVGKWSNLTSRSKRPKFETWTGSTCPNRVYPRACGGTTANQYTLYSSLTWGLSPRVRGKPSASCQTKGTLAVVYPRACGGTV